MPELALTRAHRRPSIPPGRARSRARRRTARGDDLVVALVTQHAQSVLGLARRVSLCDADAEDAYQRALEILLRHADRLDPATAPSWLRTVAKHEAMAIRAQRLARVDRVEHDPDRHATEHPSPEDQLLRFDRVTRSVEALAALKPDEGRALWLKAAGYSYAEIGERSGWTYTKVNRLLAEGRARFLSRYAAIEAGAACEEWAPAVSAVADGEASAEQRRAVGAHLRGCTACRATLHELRAARPVLHAALPMGAVLATSGLPARAAALWRALADTLTGLPERTGLAVAKAQVAVDAFSTGKVAAVTASAAAIAGGSAVVVSGAADAPPRPAEHVRAAAGDTARGHRRAEPSTLRAALPSLAAPTAAASTTAAATLPATAAPHPSTEPASAPEHHERHEFTPAAGRSSGEFPAAGPGGEFAGPSATATASGTDPQAPAGHPSSGEFGASSPAPSPHSEFAP